MIDVYLARALLSAMMILDDVARTGLDSQAALNALESIGYELGQMDADGRREFAELLERIAASGDPEQADWIRNVPGALGLG